MGYVSSKTKAPSFALISIIMIRRKHCRFRHERDMCQDDAPCPVAIICDEIDGEGLRVQRLRVRREVGWRSCQPVNACICLVYVIG